MGRLKSFFQQLIKDIDFQQLFDGAAVLSFYFFISIFPLLFVLLSLASFLTLGQLGEQSLSWWQNQVPAEISSLINLALQKQQDPVGGGTLFILILLAVFLASNGLAAVLRQLNNIYNVKKRRGFWAERLHAIGLTLGFGIFTTIPFLIDLKFQLVGLKYFLFSGFLFLALIVIYYTGPNVRTKLRYSTPGALLGSAGLGVSTKAFTYYISHFGNYGVFYGSLGTVIVVLLWLYILGLLVILGGYFNHNIRLSLGYGEN